METSIGIFNGYEVWQREKDGKLWRRSARFPEILVTEDGSFWDLVRNKELRYKIHTRKNGGRVGHCCTRYAAKYRIQGKVEEFTVARVYCTAWVAKGDVAEGRVVAKHKDTLNFTPGNLYWVRTSKVKDPVLTKDGIDYVPLPTWRQKELLEQNKARKALGLSELKTSLHTCDICRKTYEYVEKRNVCGCYSSTLEGNYIYCDWGRRVEDKERGGKQGDAASKRKAWGDSWYARKGKGRPKGSKNLPKGYGSYEESSMEASQDP
jgi:hypothetical protein